jgi:hypothetical protein
LCILLQLLELGDLFILDAIAAQLEPDSAVIKSVPDLHQDSEAQKHDTIDFYFYDFSVSNCSPLT